MTCSEVRELAGAYALDALTRHDRQRVDRHLDRCARCRRELSGLSEAASALGSLVPPAEPPAELRGRILAAVERPSRAPAPAVRAMAHQPRRVTAQGAGGWRGRLGYAMAYGAVAVILFAAGWSAGRMGLDGARGHPGDLERQLVAASLQQELWRGMAGGESEVLPLQMDRTLNRALAFAGVAGTDSGCQLRVLAAGVPAPPRGFSYEAWVLLSDGSARRVGSLERVSPERWELVAFVPAPARDVRALQVFLQRVPQAAPAPVAPPAAGEPGRLVAGVPEGRKVMWGQLWTGPANGEW